jgi:hypothetical protein
MANDQLNVPPSTSLPNTNEEPLPYVIVGDEDFGLRKYLLRPYARKNLNRIRRMFNYRLTRARRFVECTFGILARKWRFFLSGMMVQPDFAELITKTACTLHNFVRRRDGYNFEDTHSREMEGVPVCSTGSSLQPRDIRDRFANYFVSPQGEVEWQYQRI